MNIKSVMMHSARLAVLFGTVAVAVSCSNDDGIAKTIGDPTANTAGDATPQAMTLTADFPTTRVGFDASGNGYWHFDDDIAVWSATDNGFVMFENQGESVATTATFKGKIAASDVTEETLVLYPYNTSHTQTTYNLPANYTYANMDEDYTAADGTKNSFRMPMKGAVSVGDDGTRTVSFKHIGGVLAIKVDKLPSDKGKIEVTSSNGNICGNATIGTDELGTPDGSDKVSFSYEGATVDSSGVFYLPMSPGKYDLTVKVYDQSNTLKNTTIKDNVQIQRGHIKKFTANCAYVMALNDHGFIDLGLPSGTLWAETNVGATVATECGDYYTWAETTTKSVYWWENHKYYDYKADSLWWLKYTNESGLTTLEPSDDAATANWGSLCHIPTLDEINELMDESNCTWTWTTKKVSGTSSAGYEVTSKTNGNSIFLPAAGVFLEKGKALVGSEGIYWSSTLANKASNDDAYIMYCKSFRHYEDDYGRVFGCSVRPVVNP